jgi:hypothetical protein
MKTPQEQFEIDRDEAAENYPEQFWGEFSYINEPEERLSYKNDTGSFAAGANWANERTQCSFCKNTGKHLSPDVAEPIVVTCSKKGCVYGELTELRADKLRLDWMIKNGAMVSHDIKRDRFWCEIVTCAKYRAYDGVTPRESIDAAMKELK